MGRQKDVWSKDITALLAEHPESVWARIQAIAARGGRPVVTMPLSCEVIVPPRSPGRPRLHAEGSKRGDGYALITSSGRPMRCRRRGCQKALRKNATTICCSAVCADLVRRELENILDVLDGRVEAKYFAGARRINHPELNRMSKSDERFDLTPRGQVFRVRPVFAQPQADQGVRAK